MIDLHSFGVILWAVRYHLAWFALLVAVVIRWQNAPSTPASLGKGLVNGFLLTALAVFSVVGVWSA